MQWIVDNWLILLLIGGMAAMHLFGHGHGGHGQTGRKRNTTGKHANHGQKTRDAGAAADKEKMPVPERSADDERV